jgi:hypothetical protein
MVIFEPRMRLSSAGFRPSSSVPENLAEPEARPLRASRPMTAMKVWLLPEPLSPTTPRVSPRGMESETPRTALTVPSWVSKSTRRFSRVRTAGGDAGKDGLNGGKRRP